MLHWIYKEKIIRLLQEKRATLNFSVNLGK